MTGLRISVVVVLWALLILYTGQSLAEENPVAHSHFGYNLTTVSLGVDIFFKENGRLPFSADELTDSGLLPAGLTNPLTGQALNFAMFPVEPGGIGIVCSRGESMELVVCDVNGREKILPIDTSKYVSTDISSQGLRMVLYMHWAENALVNYQSAFGSVPSNLTELMNSVFWPFEGQKNPFTGEPLTFAGETDGSIIFRFNPDHVSVHVNYSGDKFGMVRVPFGDPN
mgnify:CR=1 FL=1